jgi:hypothetical protein
MPTSPDHASPPQADPPLPHTSGPLRKLEQVLGKRFPPLLFQSREAFRRDLPQLLRQHYRKWVAYSGDQQLGLCPSKTRLYQECLRRGLEPGQFLVFSIEPEVPREVEVSPEV